MEEQWSKQIKLAVLRAVKRREDRPDAEQEARIALWKAGEIPNEKLAYTVARRAVLNYLRGARLPEIALDSVKTLQNPVKPDFGFVLDAVTKLPEPERTVIQYLYGIGQDEKTHNELAFLLGKSRFWIRRKKLSGLKKLKGIL